MANEITVIAGLIYANPANNILAQNLLLSNTSGVPSKQFSIAGKNYVSGSVLAATTAGGSVISTGDLSTFGLSMWVNLDNTNYIEIIGNPGGVKLARLNAGEAALFRIDPVYTSLNVQANTASVLTAFFILEN